MFDLKNEERQQAINAIKKNNIVLDEFMDFFLGDYIGSGISRIVFDYKLDKKLVIKIDISAYNANVLEFNNWQSFKETKEAKWFAPVEQMSICGRILLQRKCKPIEDIGKLPKKLPSFLTDVKDLNFGYLNNQLVCFDYPFVIGSLNKKLRPVKW